MLRAHRHQTHLLQIAVLGLFLVLTLPFWSHGLGSLDANGIVGAVNQTLAEGNPHVSRPPGHPLTENLLYPGMVVVIEHLGGPGVMTPSLYALIQTLWGLSALVLFHSILQQFGLSLGRQAIALLGLLASSSFLEQSVDGEEFLAALTLTLVAWRCLLAVRTRHAHLAWFLAGLAYAGAVACRLEYLAALIVPAAFLITEALGQKRWHWTGAFTFSFAFMGASALLWWQLVMHSGLQPPFPLGMDLSTKVQVAGYKLLFQVYSPFIIPVVAWLLWQARHALFKLSLPQHGHWLIAALIGYVVYHLLFFYYPTKTAFLLVAAPWLWFILASTARLPGLFVILFLIAVQPFVRMDLFEDRQFVGPTLKSGSYLSSIAGKPKTKQPTYNRYLATFQDPDTRIITPFWNWDFAYWHTAQNTPDQPESILLSRSMIQETDQLLELQQNGFTIYCHEVIFRQIFHRHEPWKALQAAETRQGITFHLFGDEDLKQPKSPHP